MRRNGLSTWIVMATVALLPLTALAAAPEALTSWTGESYPGTADATTQPGSWVLGADGLTVTQSANGAPTFFATTHPADDHRITLEFDTPTTGDNDFFGFALGFDPGDTSNAGADFLLVDWRQNHQTIEWFDSPIVGGTEGLAVTRITGIPLWGEMWSHDDLGDGATVSELSRAITLGDTGWDEEVTYHFLVEYETDRLRIWVNDVLEFDLTSSDLPSDDFPTGGFALYNFSQIGVEAGPVTFEEINEPPAVDSAATDVTVNEGAVAATSGSFTDPDGDPLVLTCSRICTGFIDNGDGTWTWSRVEPEGPAAHTVTITADDGLETVVDSFSVDVLNLPPVITATSGVPDKHPLDTALSVSADFVDPGVEDTHTATFTWGDGTSSPGTVVEAAGSGAASGEHTYAAPGTYVITVTVTDDDGASDTATIGTVFVFDPDTFVTGGGWITAPAGAVADSPAAQKSTFGFVVRYTRTGSVAGNLEFHAGKALRLHATSFGDLRIAAGIATFSGTGRIGKTDGYRFEVVATDERYAAADQDLFWIRVLDPDGIVVFDGAALPAAGAPIKGRGIQIHG